MDLTGEATVERFKIGPTSAIGRAIALRILLSGSITHLRKKILLLLWTSYAKLRSAILSILSWFQPSRNTQGILITVSVTALLLNRFTKVRSRAETAYRRKFWRNVMEEAITYEEWAYAAKMLEKRESPLATNEFDLYDVELVRNKLEELRQRRRRQRDGGGSFRDIVFSLRADLLRNLGNMCNPQLHVGRLQVPKLIKEYIDEVSMQLRMVCDSDSDDLLLEEKLSFMHETRHAFGRTALLLSGGSSLGAFHVGVVRTLVENRLLPRIVAGSSVGSIICAVVGTRSWPELESFFEDDIHTLQFFDQLGGLFTVVRRIMTRGALHDIRQLQRLLRHLTNNLTFEEAFDMTGRILGITVCSPRKHEPPRCLNYLTSPHVVIWSAVTASCAFPGLFEAQELMAKNRYGELVPFHAPFPVGVGETHSYCASTRRWRDGSLEIDLPMMQLKELFNVNHFIVSQANPHIAPLLRLKKLVRSYGGGFAAKLAHLTEMEIKHRCNQILELGFPLGGVAKLFAQEWEGDVTVVMPATLSQYSKIIQNPSYPEIQKAIDQGRRGSWEKLSAIKANCAIELVLDECVAILNRMRRLKRSAERAAGLQGSTNVVTLTTSGSRRIPSWNCIARENSTGSLEDEALSDAAADYNQTANCQGATSNRNDTLVHRTTHDSSDSESDTAELHCWTRAGGPLMRTPSANKFINFVQNLNIESELTASQGNDKIENHAGDATQVATRYLDGISSESRSFNANLDSDLVNQVQVTCGSIVVSDGDLLQPEKSEHGIVINVVKREDFNGVSGSDICADECAYSPDEVGAETLQINSCNGSTSSDSDEDDYSR